MTLVPYNKNDLTIPIYKRSSNLKILEEFANSDLDCARVDGYTQSKPQYCVNSLSNSIKQFGMYGIKVIRRKDDVFLIKVK